MPASLSQQQVSVFFEFLQQLNKFVRTNKHFKHLFFLKF